MCEEVLDKFFKPHRIEKKPEWTMLEHREEFALLIQTTENTLIFSKMQAGKTFGTSHAMQKTSKHRGNEHKAEDWRRKKSKKKKCRCLLRAEKFGILIRADHRVLNEGCGSRDNHRYAVLVQDVATQWIQSYPCKINCTSTPHRLERQHLKWHVFAM